MHSYEVDAERRNYALWILASTSIAIAALLTALLNKFENDSFFLSWLPAPGGFLIFYFLYKALDRFFWKIKLVRFFLRIKTVDLSGNWDVNLKPGDYPEINARAKITQTWTKIGISIPFSSSTSCSMCASIFFDRSQPRIVYTYENAPHVRESQTMTRHLGSAEVFLLPDNSLVGTYFTSGDRGNHGTIIFKKN